MADREVKTTLFNILSHVVASWDYGYHDDVLMQDFAEIVGSLSNKEIEQYIESCKSSDYTEEDYERWEEILKDWRYKFIKVEFKP